MKKKFYQKLAATVLGVFFLMVSVVPTAQAATLEQLQAQIQTLMAQISAMQAQIGGVSATNNACPYTWTRSLSIGSTGADVMKLQQFLNNRPETVVSTFGAGSRGSETQYYGPATAAAVTKFQNMYRAEVLAPHGLAYGTGYFGPSSMAKANSLCAVVIVPTVPTTPTPTTPTTPAEPSTNKTEASLDKFKVSSGEDTNLEEGQKNVQVMDVEFSVQDGDISISRVDVAFDYQFGNENDPWRTFKEVSLYADGKKVASLNTSNRSTWSRNDPYSGAHRVRFSGLDIEVDKNEKAKLSVGVTLENTIRGADSGLSWDVLIPNNGIRARDGAGIEQYTGLQSHTVNIDINQAGVNDELSIRSSDDDQDGTMLVLKNNTRSNWITVFTFELDSDKSENDIDILQLPVALTVGTSTVGTFLDNARLVVDGKTYTDVSITDGTTNNMNFSFDFDDFVIDAGDRATVELQVRFKPLATAYEGTTIQGSVSSNDIVAEGVENLMPNQLSGSVTGEVHTMRTSGISLASTQKHTATTQGTNHTTGIFTLKFDVTAFENDFYITTKSGESITEGVKYSVQGPNVFSATTTSALSSTARERSPGVYKINEGNTETFTLSVSVDPDTRGFYRVALDEIFYTTNPDGVTNAEAAVAIPASNYQTSVVNINAS